MEGGKGDPRFEKYEEQLDETGQAIGFRIEGCDFLFEYDKHGGWFDQNKKYYTAEGILAVPPPHSDSDQDIDDEEIVDQFEKILLEEEQGIPITKNQVKKQKNVKQASVEELLEMYIKKENIRTDLPEELQIYFKMKNECREPVVLTISKESNRTASANEKNVQITQALNKILEKKKYLLEKNKWIKDQNSLHFSGGRTSDKHYYRYWYGAIKCKPQEYLQVLKDIDESQEFQTLEDKNYYSLKSKFYIKKQMAIQHTQHLSMIHKCHQENIKDVQNIQKSDSVFHISINCLPEYFPLSFIYDLLDFCGGSFQDLISVEIKDETTVEVQCYRRSALKFANIEGYCHAQGHYIWLQYLSKGIKQRAAKHFEILIEKNDEELEKQFLDCLYLRNTKEELLRLYKKQESKIVLGCEYAVRRVLMYRGDSLVVVKVM